MGKNPPPSDLVFVNDIQKNTSKIVAEVKLGEDVSQ